MKERKTSTALRKAANQLKDSQQISLYCQNVDALGVNSIEQTEIERLLVLLGNALVADEDNGCIVLERLMAEYADKTLLHWVILLHTNDATHYLSSPNAQAPFLLDWIFRLLDECLDTESLREPIKQLLSVRENDFIGLTPDKNTMHFLALAAPLISERYFLAALNIALKLEKRPGNMLTKADDNGWLALGYLVQHKSAAFMSAWDLLNEYKVDESLKKQLILSTIRPKEGSAHHLLLLTVSYSPRDFPLLWSILNEQEKRQALYLLTEVSEQYLQAALENEVFFQAIIDYIDIEHWPILLRRAENIWYKIRDEKLKTANEDEKPLINSLFDAIKKYLQNTKNCLSSARAVQELIEYLIKMQHPSTEEMATNIKIILASRNERHERSFAEAASNIHHRFSRLFNETATESPAGREERHKHEGTLLAELRERFEDSSAYFKNICQLAVVLLDKFDVYCQNTLLLNRIQSGPVSDIEKSLLQKALIALRDAKTELDILDILNQTILHRPFFRWLVIFHQNEKNALSSMDATPSPSLLKEALHFLNTYSDNPALKSKIKGLLSIREKEKLISKGKNELHFLMTAADILEPEYFLLGLQIAVKVEPSGKMLLKEDEHDCIPLYYLLMRNQQQFMLAWDLVASLENNVKKQMLTSTHPVLWLIARELPDHFMEFWNLFDPEEKVRACGLALPENWKPFHQVIRWCPQHLIAILPYCPKEHYLLKVKLTMQPAMPFDLLLEAKHERKITEEDYPKAWHFLRFLATQTVDVETLMAEDKYYHLAKQLGTGLQWLLLFRENQNLLDKVQAKIDLSHTSPAAEKVNNLFLRLKTYVDQTRECKGAATYVTDLVEYLLSIDATVTTAKINDKLIIIEGSRAGRHHWLNEAGSHLSHLFKQETTQHRKM